KSEIEIKITVPEERMHEFKKKACDEISKDVKVKGFRPGHVPHNVLEQYVDKNLIKAQTQQFAIQQIYTEVAIKENLQVVSRPKVDIDSEEPLKFTAKVAVLPEVEIKDYKKIKVKKMDSKVTDKDIEQVVDDMKKYGTTFKDVERAVQKGDRVEVDFEGFDEGGASVENTKSSNHPVIIGEGSLIPGFEEELIGLKKDEKKEFDITFPKDYGKESFQNKKMKFKVQIKKIEEPSIPELDEALIEKMTGKKQTVEEFKKEIEKNIQAKKDLEAKQKQENDYIEKLLERTNVDMPESLIDEESEYILMEMKEDVEHKGIEFGKFLEQSKTTEDDLRKKYRPEGERRIKIRLALQYLITEERVEVTEDDLKAELEKIKANYPPDQEKKIQEEFEGGKLKAQLKNRLALRKLFDKVLA
ncbi:MAG: trigger factor, partial [bacterium]|nr:trigger factor [bacterium]